MVEEPRDSENLEDDIALWLRASASGIEHFEYSERGHPVAARVTGGVKTRLGSTAEAVGAALCRDAPRSDRISRHKAAPTVPSRVLTQSDERVVSYARQVHSLTLAATLDCGAR